jgi:HxlR-like helix-turn-helix
MAGDSTPAAALTQFGTFKCPPPMSDAIKSRGSYAERVARRLYTAIGVIDGRWKPLIDQRPSETPRGFGELRRAMPRVTAKVLREQRCGQIQRNVRTP